MGAKLISKLIWNTFFGLDATIQGSGLIGKNREEHSEKEQTKLVMKTHLIRKH